MTDTNADETDDDGTVAPATTPGDADRAGVLFLPLIDATGGPWTRTTDADPDTPLADVDGTVAYEYGPDPARLHLHRAGAGPAGGPEDAAAGWQLTVDGRDSRWVDSLSTSNVLTDPEALRRLATNTAITIHALHGVATGAGQHDKSAFDFGRMEADTLLAEANGEYTVAERIARDKAVAGDDQRVNFLPGHHTDSDEQTVCDVCGDPIDAAEDGQESVSLNASDYDDQRLRAVVATIAGERAHADCFDAAVENRAAQPTDDSATDTEDTSHADHQPEPEPEQDADDE